MVRGKFHRILKRKHIFRTGTLISAVKTFRRHAIPNRILENKQNHKLTEYFKIRKSDRKTKSEVQEEKKRLMQFALKKGVENGLEVVFIYLPSSN